MVKEMRTSADQKAVKQKQKEINRYRDDFRAKTTKDEIRAKFEKGERKEATEAQKRFDSNPDQVLRVDKWITEAGQASTQYRPEPPISYDQDNPLAHDLEWRAGPPDLDAPERAKLLKAYENKKSESIEKTTTALKTLSDKYLSDMKKLDSKTYNNLEERKNRLNGRYSKFRDDALLILGKETIKMNKAAATVGLTREQVQPYTSTTEKGGIYRLPGAPQFDQYENLLLE